MKIQILKIFSLLALMILLANCASNRMGMAQGDEECDAMKSAGAGALIGGLIGAAVDGEKGALKGAAVGAAAGGFGCLAMNYHSRQVRNADQVNKQYEKQHKQLPEKPLVTDYQLKAPKQAVRGNPVSVNSSMTVVDGRSQSVDRVEEKLFIVNHAGERKQIKSKQASGGINTGGEYSNSFSFTPPSGVAQGNYRLESEVYVNDKLAKTAKAPIALAYGEGDVMVLAFAK